MVRPPHPLSYSLLSDRTSADDVSLHVRFQSHVVDANCKCLFLLYIDETSRFRHNLACNRCATLIADNASSLPLYRYKLDCQFPPGTKTVPRPTEGASNGGAAGGSANGGEPSPAVTQK